MFVIDSLGFFAKIKITLSDCLMLIGILIIDALSVLIMLLILGGARKTYVKRRYLFCTLRHEGHSADHCPEVPIRMGPVKTYIFLNVLLIFLSLFLYLSF